MRCVTRFLSPRPGLKRRNRRGESPARIPTACAVGYHLAPRPGLRHDNDRYRRLRRNAVNPPNATSASVAGSGTADTA